MITLHGTYNNGKIEIKEKNIPDIQARVNIHLLEANFSENKMIFDWENGLSSVVKNMNSVELQHRSMDWR